MEQAEEKGKPTQEIRERRRSIVFGRFESRSCSISCRRQNPGCALQKQEHVQARQSILDPARVNQALSGLSRPGFFGMLGSDLADRRDWLAVRNTLYEKILEQVQQVPDIAIASQTLTVSTSVASSQQ